MSFQTFKEAADFLASRIVQEASLRHVPLSDLDRKALYFFKADTAAPDMEDSVEKAEDDFDDLECGNKISRLSRGAYRRDREQSREMERLWREAIATIKKENPYLPTLYNVPRSARDIVGLIATALLVIATGFAVVVGFKWIGHRVRVTIPDGIQIVAFLLALLVFSYLGSNAKLIKRVSERLGNVIEHIFGP